MSRTSLLLALLAPCSLALADTADWPQWRGPLRNGTLPNSQSLATHWPPEGPARLWESDPIPSDEDGGHGSAVVAEGRVFLSVVWHRDEPSETRTITDLILRTRLNHQNPSSLGKELVEKIESTRESLSSTLRGKKLDEFSERFIEENLNRKQKEFFGGFVRNRFKQGKLAIPLPDYDKLRQRVDKPFASQTELESWVNEQGFADHVKQAVLEAIPASRRVAEDTVICLDAASGKTLWTTRVPGEPKGRNCSSTPCVANGRVFALGSTHVYAVNTANGEIAWSRPLPGKAPGSSPIVVGNAVVLLAGKLAAFDAQSGEPVWEQPAIAGTNASPAVWESNGKRLILINGRNEFAAIDPTSGNVVWTTPGGGDSTPAIQGDVAAVLSSKENIGFAAYQLAPTGVTLLWNHPTDARRSQSSPVIHDGQAFLFEDGDHRCVELLTGKVAWTQKVPSTITSPILADGKFFVVANNGNNLLMVEATSKGYNELGRTNVKALWIPSPTIANGRIFIRHREGVRCYDLCVK
jgi:outer membrane protein assembly factor BamB